MGLSFLLDENLPSSLLRSLRGAGYNTVRLKTQGISDTEVLKNAKDEQRTVITFDRDFANTLCYPPEEFSGIILLRRRSGLLSVTDIQIFTNRLLELLEGTNSFDGQLFIVDRAKVRQYQGLTSICKEATIR
jgi:predicted nuclease of predicted toxin-antitoxin system